MPKPQAEIKNILMIVCDKKHPHFGCYGYLTGKVIELGGTAMAEIIADNCKHGTNGFFVSQGQIRRSNTASVAISFSGSRHGTCKVVFGEKSSRKKGVEQ